MRSRSGFGLTRLLSAVTCSKRPEIFFLQLPSKSGRIGTSIYSNSMITAGLCTRILCMKYAKITSTSLSAAKVIVCLTSPSSSSKEPRRQGRLRPAIDRSISLPTNGREIHLKQVDIILSLGPKFNNEGHAQTQQGMVPIAWG